MLVLIKLRLNLGDQDLVFRVSVNQSTVSRCISKWVDVLYICLKPLIKWPERDELMKTMPMDFRKNFKNCIIIIDCFEVCMERPTNLRARAQTWSNYKHHNTVKFYKALLNKVQSLLFRKDGGDVPPMCTLQKIVECLTNREMLFWRIGASMSMIVLACTAQQ